MFREIADVILKDGYGSLRLLQPLEQLILGTHLL